MRQHVHSHGFKCYLPGLILSFLALASPLRALIITRGPYLQDAAAGSIVLMWETDIPADSTVRYGLASVSELAAVDPALVQTHEVLLTGLAAATAYLYRVESSDGAAMAASADYDFLTAPASATAPVRFAAIADTGGPTVTSALAARILADMPDLVIHAGDIQYGDPADPGSWDTYFFDPGAELWARVPAYPVLGNHEYPSSQNPAAAPQLFLDYFSLPGDERFYSFDHGCVHFTALDVYQNSDAPDNWYLTAAQRSWLQADLSAAQAAGTPWTVVYFHYPAFSSAASTTRPWEAPFQADLVPIFEAYGVDYVVMGHHHVYNRSNRSGITYVITGGGGAALHAVSASPFSVNPNHHRVVSSQYEYVLFDATATRMTMTAKQSDGAEIDREVKANVRRNIVLFIGDGMGFEHVQAGRLYAAGSDATPLDLENAANFPYQGQVVTTLAGGGITDSAAAGTAFATGYQTNVNGIISEEGTIKTTILELARDNGQRAGLITTAPFVDATPAAFGAHDNNRSHYSDLRWDFIDDDDASRPDGDHPGTFANVLFGGGLQNATYGMDAGYRSAAAAAGYALAFTRSDLFAIDMNLEDRVMGLLDNAKTTGYLMYQQERIDGLYPASDEPTLAEMTARALDLLEESPRGFFLMVEDELIDELSHGNAADRSAYLGPEVNQLDAAVRIVLDWAAASGQAANTLVLVVADHETGGLNVPDGQTIPPGTTPAMTWGGTAHTAANVPVYATWPAGLAALAIDNTEVFHILADYLYDGRAPVTGGVAVSGLTDTTATITWTTDEPSDSRVDYGTTDAYGLFSEDPAHARLLSHAITLTGLAPGTLYHFSASSRDIAGYAGSSPDATFITAGPPPAAPAGLVATDTGGAVQLDWLDSPEPAVVGYNVYRAGAAGGPYAQLNAASTLVAVGSSWKYHDQGANLGTAWKQPAYDDSAWLQGPAELGYGDGDEATIVSYGPNANAKYITTYFRRTISVPNPSVFTDLTLRLRRDDGTVVYLNGVEAARSNMPSGTIAYTTLAPVAVGGADETTFFVFTVPALSLISGANVIAVELHQANATSSDISFDLELIGNSGPVVASQFTDSAAPAGLNAYYVVTAVDGAAQESPDSAEVCAAPGAPAAPSGLAAAAGDAEAALNWDDAAECDAAGYHVYRSGTPGGPYAPLTASPVAASAYTDTGLANGTSYYYAVTAVDLGDRESGLSAEASATPRETVPPVISGVEAVDIGTTAARIVWTTDEPADSRVDYGLSASYGSSAADGALTVSHSLILAGLAPGTLYHYQVTSRDASGNGASSADATFTTAADGTPPVLSDMQAVDVTDSGARIVWTTDEAADSLVEYGLDAGYGQAAFDGALVLSHSVSLAGLSPATTYHYRVSSADSAGNYGTSGDLAFVTAADSTPPAAPAGLTAAGGDGQADLDWSDNLAPDLAGYLVYRGTTPGGPYALAGSPAASAHLDTGLTNGATYYYVVTAVDASGNESPYSAEAFATPVDALPPGAPAGLAATAGDDAVALDWADSPEPDLAGYNVYRSTTSGSGFAKLNGAPVAASAYGDGSVLRGGVYYYRVAALDTSGNESPPANEVSAGTPGFHFTFAASVTVARVGGGTLTVPDEDIVRYDPIANAYALFFDGTAAGLVSNQDVDAFDLLPSGQVLISLDGDSSVPGLGTVDDSDITMWTPGSPGRYPGAWTWYFDGSDVGLSTPNEDIDSFTLLPDGRLLVSTIGSASAGGLSWTDEDLMAFTFGGAPGASTSGTWAWHFDGSDVGLGDLSTEDVWGCAPRLAGNALYLTTQGAYSVTGLPSGTGVDVLLFTPTALGAATSGSYALVFDGSASGLPDSSTIDGLDLAP